MHQGSVAELAVQRMGDLEEILRVEARIQALVALVVGAGMQHLVVHELAVVRRAGVSPMSTNSCPCVPAEVSSFATPRRRRMKVVIERVRDVQAQAVDHELGAPFAHAVQQVLHDLGVAQVELDEVEAAFPALIPKAVVKGRIAVEVGEEPIAVGRVPALFAHILEGPRTRGQRG